MQNFRITGITKFISVKFFCIFFFFFFFYFSNTLFAQIANDSTTFSEEESLPILPKKYFFCSPRLSVSVPLPMANKSFKKVFVGVYEFNTSFNLYVKQGAFIGFSYDYGMFRIPDNKIPNYNASMKLHNFGLRLGGDFYAGERNIILVSPAITIGNNWTKFGNLKVKNTLEPPTNTSYTTSFVKPEINFFYLIERDLAVGFNLAYCIQNYSFDPYQLKLNEWASFSKNNSKRTQYLNIGFSFFYNFIPKKSK